MEEEVSITRAKLAEMEIDKEIDTGNEKDRDDNKKTGEAMQNVANCWTMYNTRSQQRYTPSMLTKEVQKIIVLFQTVLSKESYRCP